MITKKDYDTVSRCFRGLHAERGPEGIALALMVRLAAMFANDNPRFNRERFVEACKKEFNKP